MDEYADKHERGDFLVRGVVGADTERRRARDRRRGRRRPHRAVPGARRGAPPTRTWPRCSTGSTSRRSRARCCSRATAAGGRCSPLRPRRAGPATRARRAGRGRVLRRRRDRPGRRAQPRARLHRVHPRVRPAGDGRDWRHASARSRAGAPVLAIDIGGTKMAAALVEPGGRSQPTTGSRPRTAPTSTPRRSGGRWRRCSTSSSPTPATRPSRASASGCGGPMTWPAGEVSPLNIPALARLPAARPACASATRACRSGCTTTPSASPSAEHWRGAGRGRDNMLGMVVSTGVGGGLILGGRLVDGASGNAGHIGHVVVDPDGPRLRCGGRGCLEAIARGPGARRLGARTGWRPAERRATGVELAADARARPPGRRARRCERAGRAIGVAIASATHLCDLEVVAIGGGLSQAGPLLFEPLEEAFRAHARHGVRPRGRVVPAALGQTAGLVGAAALVFARRPLLDARLIRGRGHVADDGIGRRETARHASPTSRPPASCCAASRAPPRPSHGSLSGGSAARSASSARTSSAPARSRSAGPTCASPGCGRGAGPRRRRGERRQPRAGRRAGREAARLQGDGVHAGGAPLPKVAATRALRRGRACSTGRPSTTASSPRRRRRADRRGAHPPLRPPRHRRRAGHHRTGDPRAVPRRADHRRVASAAAG